MPRFAANLEYLFTELPFLDRFAAAAQAGFTAVEFQRPYSYPADVLLARLRDYSLSMVLHNLPAGDWAAGERGIACHPGRQVEFREGVELARSYASNLGCEQVNCLAGITPTGYPEDQLREVLLDNIRYAAQTLGEAGIRLNIEAINNRDMPGFYLPTTAQVVDAITQAGVSNIYLQFDIYHVQIMEGDLSRRLERYLDLIGHIQIADNPGRHEPGTGEINYPFLFAHLDRLGYRGWVSCEYQPLTTTLAGLAWLDAVKR